MDLVIAGNAFLSGKLEKCCIGIEDGKISAIKKILKGDKFYDFGDKLILPGGIDIHVHFREPGLSHKEDFESGTLSAAFGGITAIIDMPNTIPPTIDMEALEEKIKIGKRKSYIDFGLYSAVTDKTNLKNLSGRTTGFKMYLGETTGKLTYKDFNELSAQLQELKGGPSKVLAIHAEQSEILEKGALDVPDDKYKNLAAHSKRRPVIAEVSAVRAIIEFHKNYIQQISSNSKGVKAEGGITKFHICHVSSAESLDMLKKYAKMSFEGTPHHMLLNTKSHSALGTLGKVNPPVRDENNQRTLWHAFCDGEIPIVASDHAPHTLNEKEQPFNEAPAGMPSVECLLPLLLSRMKHGSIQLHRLVEAVSVRPATLFEFNKGHIAVGFDADLIAVDMRREETLKTNMLHSKCEWTPYKNMDVIVPVMTVSSGNIVIRNENVEADRGSGEYLIGGERKVN